MLKKIIAIMFIVFCGLGLCACGENEDIIRIHIRANSNSQVDQEVKLSVRDKVIECITPLIASCNSSEDVKLVLSSNLELIESVSDSVLRDNGFEYVSSASIRYEYFPTREYGDKTFPADYYDALILELGSGDGDNWWCVAYPPLCFVGKDAGTSGLKYKSKIIELINKYFG